MTTTIDRDELIGEIADVRERLEALQARFYEVMSEVRELPGGQRVRDRVDAYPGLRLDRDMGAGSDADGWLAEVGDFLEDRGEAEDPIPGLDDEYVPAAYA